MSTQTPSHSPASREGAPPESSAPPRRRALPILLGLGVLILVAAAIAWLHYRNRESTDDAEVETHVESIAPRVAGTVVEVDVNDNQMVKAGQVLFRLDASDYQAALEQAQANLRAAQAAAGAARTNVPLTQTSTGSNLTAAQASVGEAQAEQTLDEDQTAAAKARVTAAQAQQAQAEAQAADAAANEQRYAQLVAKNEVSQQQYQAAVTQAKALAAAVSSAAAQVNAAQQQLASAQAQVQVGASKIAEAQAAERRAATVPEQVAVIRAQAATAEARVAQAQAQVDAAQLNLNYTVVRAPTDGEVGNKHVDIGDHFEPGQTALDLVPLNDIWVVANFKETQLQEMHPGQRAEISVDAYGQTLEGTVNSIGAATGSRFSLLPPENATGNYVKVVQRVPVKIVFNSGQDLSRLRPGLSVEATVFTK